MQRPAGARTLVRKDNCTFFLLLLFGSDRLVKQISSLPFSEMSFTSKTLFASLPKTQRGQPIVLGGDPKGKNFLYTHGNSVIIRNIEDPSIAESYTEHSCQVNVAKYSPSGFYIASAGMKDFALGFFKQYVTFNIYSFRSIGKGKNLGYRQQGAYLQDRNPTICWSCQRLGMVG